MAVRPLPPHLRWLDEDGLLGPNHLGVIHWNPDPCPYVDRGVWLDRLPAVLAGPAAEARFAGARRVTVGGSDRELARYYAGVSGQRDRAQAMRDGLALARQLVAGRWPEIEAVAQRLIEWRFQRAGQVRRTMRFARRGMPG